ncbi:MAG: PAS domain S-box protein [Deltaproteobacteria bacterium]|nr:PAS domain S-box protein [Deltaproteobacteria bacterium]
MKAKKPKNETSRLKTLRRYKILDTIPEEKFDDITRLASHICGTPIAIINFIDENRQWFKSKVGLDLSETSLDVSFCKHAIQQPDIFIVRDALEDERFANNPFVTSDPNIRFYAGMPLVTPEGYRLGTLCVIDKVPRDLSFNQKEALRTLGRQVITHLELRRNLEERKKVENALYYSEQRYRVLYEDNPSMYFTVDKEGTVLSVNQFGAEQLGYTVEELVGQSVLNVFYEDDKKAVLEQLNACLQNPRRLADWELRKVHKDGSILWVREAARAVQDIDGNPVVLVFCEDITERKCTEQALRKRTEQIVRHQTALLELAKMDNSYLDKALKKITETDAKTLGVERVGVWLFNEDRSEIICKEFYKLSENSHEGGSGLHARDYPNYFRALEESRILAASHASTDPRTTEYTEGYLKPQGITSMMDVPIRLRGEVIGIVCHEHIGQPRVWELEEQDFAASIADMVSLVLEASERNRAEEALRRTRDELEIKVIERTSELVKANEKLEDGINERKRVEDELRILNSITQAMNQSIKLEEIYRIALDKVIEQEYVDIASIYLVDEYKNEAVLQDHRNFPDDFIRRAGRIPYPNGATWKVINSGKILNVKNAKEDPDVGPAGRELGFGSMLGIPIALEGRTIGVLWLLTYKEHQFSKQEEDLLTSIGRQIVIAIAKANLYRELSKKNRYETIISTVIRSVHQSINLQEVLENAVDAMSENIEGADIIAICLVEGEEAVIKSHRGFTDRYIQQAGRITYPKGFTWKTIVEGKPRYCPDVDKDEFISCAGREAGIQSYLSMPIRFESKTVGCINISSLKKNAFDEEELKLLEIVAQQIDIAINNAKKAEALQRSEERYRTLFDQSPVGVYMFDKEYRIKQCNERMAEILKSSRDRITGLDMRTLRDQSFMPLMKKGLEGETCLEEGFYEATTSSAKLWLSVCVSPLRNADGDVIDGIAVVEDITERKRAEEVLLSIAKGVSAATGEAFFQSLVEHLAKTLEADYAFIGELKDDKVKLVKAIAVYADGKIASNFDYDLAGTPCEGVVRKELCSYPSGVQQKFPHDYLLTEIGVEGYVGTPLFDSSGRPLGLMVVLYRQPVRNLNIAESMLQIFGVRASAELERKRAEEALKESEEKFRNLVEQTNDWVWEIDRNGAFTYVNPKVYEIVGYEPEEILGKTTFDFMSSEEVKRFGEVISSFISMQKPFFRLEKTLIHRDGRLVFFETSGAPIVDSNGALHGYRGIARDVTERKRIEEELLKAQKLESLGVLAGGIAHDFNNLLTAILGNISLVKMYGNPEDKAYKRLTEAEKASLRARDLTQQLLTFSKGGAPVKKVTLTKELVRESANFAQRGSNVRCEFSIAKDLWPLEVDEGQISQVINNLVINAQQAMPQGGVIKIIAENVSRGEQTIHLGSIVNGILLKEGKYVRITVEDHGIGIPEEHLSKIFDPYFTTKQKGSGLGLAVTYSIIRNHDGYIGVESKLGVGTKFYIYIPVNDSKISELINLVNESPVEGKGRILVMDDEEIVRGVLLEMLSQIGYEVGCARDGSEAIDLYIKAKECDTPFDVIIMDLTIAGGMGGKEAIKKLLEIDPDVKAIVSSGYSNDPVMSDYMKYGFIGVVNKPYKIGELSKTVYQVINGG